MKYDTAVIGGGPAGMMAAARLGELGARVILLEKNKSLGVKLLATGNGRCNLTNRSAEPREMAKKFGKNGKFLLSSLNRFAPEDVIAFFENRGVKTKEESGGRIFPASDRARDVLSALITCLEKYRVEIRTNGRVTEIFQKGDKIEKVRLAAGEEIFADNFIIATGGKSYPQTGSTGDAYDWLRSLGHRITNLTPALAPLVLKEKFIEELEGLSLKNVRISAHNGNKKIDSKPGEAIFTRDGISGPVILNMSKAIGQAFSDKIQVRIDFCPALDLKEIDMALQKSFREERSKSIKNILGKFLPARIIPIAIRLSEIDPEKKAGSATKEERKKIARLAKDFRLEVARLAEYDKAMVTAGGVDLREINPKTMKSKIIDNLYFAGEILGLAGPSGGYNLQVSWSTGYTAGDSAWQNANKAKQ